MISTEILIAAGIPLADDDTIAVLYAKAALDWMKENTTLQIDVENATSIEALPASAKLFVVKYSEIIQRRIGVVSESIEGMSQSFDTSEDVSTSIWTLARTLLHGYLKSQVRVFPAKRRW